MSVNYLWKAKPKVNLFKYINETIIQPASFLIKEENHLLVSENDVLRKNNNDLSERIEQLFLEFGLTSSTGIENKEIYIERSKNDPNENKRYPQYQNGNLSYQTEDTLDGNAVQYASHSNFQTKENLQTSTKENQTSTAANQEKSFKIVQDSVFSPNQQNSSPMTISSPMYLDIYDSRDNITKKRLEKAASANEFMQTKSDRYDKSENISNIDLNSSVHPIYSEIDKQKEDILNFINHKVHADMRILPQNSHNAPNSLNTKLAQESDSNVAILSKTFKEKLDEINSNLKKHILEVHSIDGNNLEKSSTDLSNLLKNQTTIIGILNKNSEILSSLSGNYKDVSNEQIIPNGSFLYSGNLRNSENNLEISIIPSTKSENKGISVDQKEFHSMDFGNNFETESEIIAEIQHTQLTSGPNILLKQSNREIENKLSNDEIAESLFPEIRQSSDNPKMVLDCNFSVESFSNELESSYETLYDPVINSKEDNSHRLSINTL